MSTPTVRPDGRFEQLWLPLWPLASDDLREGIYRTSREKRLVSATSRRTRTW